MGPRFCAAAAALIVLAVGATPALAQRIPRQCQYLGGAQALLPFPNDAWTVKSGATPTGRRLKLPAGCVPRNRAGKPIDVTDQNRLDGFSPGSQLILKVPGVATQAAFRRSGLAPVTDIGASLSRDAPVVILDARTRRRQAYWAELDANATTASKRTLLIHPTKNLVEGRRYVVVARGLRTATGREVLPVPDLLEPRGAKLRSLIAIARKAKVRTTELHLIWDFTVGSERSIQSRMLKIRNDAFAKLGDPNLADEKVQGGSPAFSVGSVEEFSPGQDAQLLRRVTGTFRVPCYLTSPGCAPAGRFDLDADGLPVQRMGSEQTAKVRLRDPARGDPGARTRVPLRARAARRRRRGDPRHPRPLHGPGAQLHLLCDGLERDVQRRRPQHHRHPLRPLEVPRAHRPPAAGHPQLRLPRPAHAPPVGSREPPGVPGRQSSRVRHGRPLLRRQLPRRDHRRRADRGGARLPPRGARGARHELLPPAHPQLELDDLPGGVRSSLSRPGDPAACPLAHPAAVGPLGVQRVGGAHR